MNIATRYYSEKSVRMCFACRQRDLQKNLMRFKVLDFALQFYDGNGRSFYLCCQCLSQRKTHKIIKRIVKKANNLQEQIEEIALICQVKK